MPTLRDVEEGFDDYEDDSHGTLSLPQNRNGGRQPTTVVVRQHTPWQTIAQQWKERESKERAAQGSFYVVTCNGTLRLSSRTEVVWPGIVSQRLRRAVQEAVQREHSGLLRSQKNKELVGNIKLLFRGADPSVFLELCPNPHGTMYSSEPHCNGKRRCSFDARHPEKSPGGPPSETTAADPVTGVHHRRVPHAPPPRGSRGHSAPFKQRSVPVGGRRASDESRVQRGHQ